MQSPRLPLLIGFPILTLILGWQMGVSYGQTAHGESTTRPQNQSGAVLQDPQRDADLSVLWRVWDLLNQNYVHPEELTAHKMVEGAVRGLVASLGDPYTLYMTEQENTDFRNMLDGHLEGIGAELSMKDNIPKVVRAIKGSPAEKAGLMPEDILQTVNGKTLENMTLDQIVGQIRGKKGTSVTITVLREKNTEPLSFTIIRDQIQVPSTDYQIKKTAKGDVGVLTISEFGSATINEVKAIIKTIDPRKIKGLVIDLRYNGGGYLDGAVDLASMFIRDGVVVSVAGRGTDVQVHSVRGNPVLPDLPTVVLINNGSASASEIFAGAMKDHKRATIVGMQSFGKGTVQEVIDLPGGSSLRVTIARWLTPNGTDLGKVGVTPDVVIDMTKDDAIAGKDPQMDKALELLTRS